MSFELREALGGGWPDSDNRIPLRRLIDECHIRTVIDVGSFLGASALFFAEQPTIHSVTCVDLFRYDPASTDPWIANWKAAGVPPDFYEVFAEHLREARLWHKIRTVVGRSAEMAWQLYDADLIYIDGDHSYEGCAADIRAYRPKARKVLCGDDHHCDDQGEPAFPGVLRACRELLGEYEVEGAFWWKKTA